MKLRPFPLLSALASCLTVFPSPIIAQTPIQLFGPVDVRLSQSGAGYGSSADIFNTNTLNLTCPASPTAVLSSTSNGAGFVLVDNNIYVNNLTTGTGAVNVCQGGTTDQNGALQDCFNTTYQGEANNQQITGVNPDTLAASGGVPPIDISSLLSQNLQPQQITIDLEDEGGYVASSSLYLVTNCTSGGVNAPALISGNTIPPTSPTTVQLDQDFTFNPLTGNQIGFEYDLSGAYSANTLTIDASGVNPQVGDSALDPALAYPLQVSGTSFATSMCLVHNGELLNGQPACKLFTLECTIGTGSAASGAQCPVSTLSNEILKDVFDGPAFTLPDITTPSGTTFHQGMGFLMASENWAPGPCTFDPASGLEDLPCPQNLLTSFTGPGTFTGSGQTTHPNSTFITIAQVPEDLTTVTPTDINGNTVSLGPGNWTNNPNPYVKLSSQPPNLIGTGLPGVANFVPSPILSISYGTSPGPTPPVPGTTTDTTLTNPLDCSGAALPFSPAGQPVQLSFPVDGQYLLHYYAQDCAGTKELLFTNTMSDGSGAWSTNFYTFPINVDTVSPEVVSGPTLSPSGPYYEGQPVTATYECTDDRSGVVSCGTFTSGPGILDTHLVMSPVDTSSGGAKTFTVVAVDAAGNKSAPQSAPYQVNVDSQIQLTLSPSTVTYPLGTNLTVKVANINGHVPTGPVEIMEKGTPLANLTLSSGAAYYYLKGLSAGMHYLSAVYSGDGHNAAGTSAPVALNVLQVPVTLSLSCWNTPYPYGADFHCGVYASSNAGAPLGSITYVYDGGTPVTVPLSSGSVNFTIPKPLVGNHSVVVTYPAQTNYAAAGPKTQNFTVTPAPVVVQFTPSSWYLTGGNLTLTASVQSWSAGPPNTTGAVTFKYGATVLSGVAIPVNASGSATLTIPASSLPNGNDALTAIYSGGANYATGSTTITVQVAH
ncbi:MAG: Ig-like domain-containing protein [Terracidiphilus sp.]